MSDSLEIFLDNSLIDAGVHVHAGLDRVKAVVDELFVNYAYEVSFASGFGETLVLIGSHLEWLIGQTYHRDGEVLCLLDLLFELCHERSHRVVL